ncbi:MAG: patatin-like phospholipase family protein [Polyangia bacterium]
MYNILSLDGGGSWALIQVMMLQRLYGADAPGSHVLKHFDLVVANSGGSLVAAGLLLDLKLSALRSLFQSEEYRSQIFVPIRPWKRVLPGLVGVGPRYQTRAKLQGLQNIFGRFQGDVTLTQAAERISVRNGRRIDAVIIAYHYNRDRSTYFRSNLASLAGSFARPQPVLLAEAVHASTNAPVNYFDEPALVTVGERSDPFWDGAVAGCNNPILSGLIEARANGAPASEIRALSLGTGTTFLPLPDGACTAQHPCLLAPTSQPGFRTDLHKLASCILSDPPDSASFIAHVLLGGRIPTLASEYVTNGPVVRLNPLIQPVLGESKTWILPPKLRGTDCRWGEFPIQAEPALSAEAFTRLRDLDMDACKPEEIGWIEEFAALWMEDHIPNQPIRPTQLLDCQIGHRWFSQGLSQALSYFGFTRQRAVA